MVPMVQSMNQFIMGETQAQLDGLDRVVGSFINRMNGTLDGQLSRLGQTLMEINRSQQVDFNALNTSLDAASSIMQHLQGMGTVMEQVMGRLENFVGEVGDVRAEQVRFNNGAQELLGNMHHAVQEQNEYLIALRAGHENLQNSMQDYAQWSGRVLEAVREQADASAQDSRDVAAAMRDSSNTLSASYASFVENIAQGLSRSMSQFEKNMNAVVNLLDGRLENMEKTAKSVNGQYDGRVKQLNDGTDGLITTLSRMQRAMSDMTVAVEQAVKAVSERQEG